jgi:hypothetical protein
MSRFNSDSNYAAVTRHRRPYSTTGRPPAAVDDLWASDNLDDDMLEISPYEAAIAPLLGEDDLEADTVAVSPVVNSSAAANTASDRRRRNEWTDLGFDQVDDGNATAAMSATSASREVSTRAASAETTASNS